MKFTMKSLEHILKERGLNSYGAAQKYIDSEVLRLSDPYVPSKTGKLRESAFRATEIGSGLICYDAPYARAVYYGMGASTGSSKQGKLWFERMKADHKEAILAGTRKVTGAI